MSDSGNFSAPPRLPPGPAEPPPRSGFLTALMVFAGIILLLPGLCALVFGAISLTDPRSFGIIIMPFALPGLLVGFGGVMLIRAAVRRPRTDRQQQKFLDPF